MALLKCPECGGNVSDKAKACPNCGFPVKDIILKRKCPECGNEVSDKVNICPNCGFPFEDVILKKKCPNCGYLVPRMAKACPSCGFTIREMEDITKSVSNSEIIQKETGIKTNGQNRDNSSFYQISEKTLYGKKCGTKSEEKDINIQSHEKDVNLDYATSSEILTTNNSTSKKIVIKLIRKFPSQNSIF